MSALARTPKAAASFASSLHCTPVAGLPWGTIDFSCITKAQTAEAIALSEGANAYFAKSISKDSSRLTQHAIYNIIAINLCAGRFHKILPIARDIKNSPYGASLVTPQLYVLLLQSLARKASREHHNLTLRLFEELCLMNISPHCFQAATKLLAKQFSRCPDFTQLLSLRLVYESSATAHLRSLESDCSYYSCVLTILLNSGQYTMAVDQLEQFLDSSDSEAFKSDLVDSMPLSRLLQAASCARDCPTLVRMLKTVLSLKGSAYISAWDWSSYLGIGLEQNDYDLVQLIYSQVVMEGLSDLAAVEDDVLGVRYAEVQANNSILATLSSDTLIQVLHTLASHGDVSSCLNLVEWHFIHKHLKGERALTKQLCLRIIYAYCFHNRQSAQQWRRSDVDYGVRNAVDVLESFIVRNLAHFSYTDVSDAFSHCFHNYYSYDRNLEGFVGDHAAASEQVWAQPASEEATIQKINNTNLRESPHGNMLMNTEILSRFAREHMSYIVEKNYSTSTIVIFVNCLLSHLHKYQNTTSIVIVLREMRSLNNAFASQWLDHHSHDIIIRSFADSPAALHTGYWYFQYLKRTTYPMTAQNFQNFILSSLRGHSYNSLLEYYTYEYLKAYPGGVGSRVARRINAYKNLNDAGRLLARVLKEYEASHDRDIDAIWEQNNFCRTSPQIPKDKEEYAVYSGFDTRDKEQLVQAFS